VLAAPTLRVMNVMDDLAVASSQPLEPGVSRSSPVTRLVTYDAALQGAMLLRNPEHLQHTS
jgi:hypothetical protein